MRIPRLSKFSPDQLRVECLGGLTNETYKISTTTDEFVLRLPGTDTKRYQNRKDEAYHQRIAVALDISPELFFFDEKDGLMLTDYLDQAITMTLNVFTLVHMSQLELEIPLKSCINRAYCFGLESNHWR